MSLWIFGRRRKTVPISAWSVRSFRIRPQDFEVRCLLGPSADTGKHGAFQQAADSSIQEFNRMLCSELWILWIYSGKPNADDFRAGNAAMSNDYALDFFRPGTLPGDLSSCAASARIVSLSMSNETLQYNQQERGRWDVYLHTLSTLQCPRFQMRPPPPPPSEPPAEAFSLISHASCKLQVRSCLQKTLHHKDIGRLRTSDNSTPSKIGGGTRIGSAHGG